MRIAYFLLFLLLFGIPSVTRAGFIISRPSHILPVTPVSGTDDAPATDSVKRIKSRAETFSGDYVHACRSRREHRRKTDNSHEEGGGMATAAVVCACLFEWPLAIIFGAIGMSRHNRSRNKAKVAFIVGLVEGVLDFLLIFIILSV